MAIDLNEEIDATFFACTALTVSHAISMAVTLTHEGTIDDAMNFSQKTGREIIQSVMGNRGDKLKTIGDARQVYEATLLWCLRRLGRPEVAAVEG